MCGQAWHVRLMPDIQLLCGERAALVLVKNLVVFYPSRLCSVHMKSLPCIQSFDFDKSGLASAGFTTWLAAE